MNREQYAYLWLWTKNEESRESYQGRVWKSNEAVLKEAATSPCWLKSIKQDSTRLSQNKIYISCFAHLVFLFCSVLYFFLTP